MENARDSSQLKAWLFSVCIFLAGFAAGVIFTVVLDVGGGIRETLSLPLARHLDGDLIYLKNGKTVVGRVLHQDANEILVEMEKGTVKFGTNEIASIEKNQYTRYFQKGW